MSFARELKRWRERKFLTQQGLADALGVSLTAVQRWEMGHTTPRAATRRKLVEVLGISPDEFFAALEDRESEGKAAA